MSADSRKLNVHLESTQGGKRLPVKTVTQLFDSLQTSIFHIGDYLVGSGFRERGHSIDEIQNKCELVFQNVKIGSFIANLNLQDSQTTLTGQPTLGEKSLSKFYDIIENIEKSDKIHNIIAEPNHRVRILSDINKMWPDNNDIYRVEIKNHNNKIIYLQPNKKKYLEKLLQNESASDTEVIRGVVTTMIAYPSSMIKISGPDGNVSLSTENFEFPTKYFKKPITVYGSPRFDAAGNIIEISNITNIQDFNKTELKIIISNGKELELKKPLSITIDWQKKNWIMKNLDLGIITTAKEYDSCLKEFKDEFYFVWTQYGLANDNELTNGGRNLKKKILSYLEEVPHL